MFVQTMTLLYSPQSLGRTEMSTVRYRRTTFKYVNQIGDVTSVTRLLITTKIQVPKLPFHWYFTSALPRSLLATSAILVCWLPFAVRSLILSCLGRRQMSFHPASTGLVLVAFAFVSLYSFLPHKELRFIIYAVPIFNLAAAVMWAFL
ncbi:unnamed protein product [Echinostoma caproni]|uniref:Mannosyltransferase n=1 Tax=Echinostoma caproni TaxID=27848 RepID=A0A183AY25_9TREM|nr:unnamed protein product [Echinostoma caproni]